MKEAVSYFKENKGYDRFFIKCKEKFETYDREMAGTIVIKNPTLEEKEALSGIMKKSYAKNTTIQIRIAKFQEKLNETKFSGLKIKEIVQEYFGMTMITKKRKKEIKQEKKLQFLKELCEELKNTRAAKIVEMLLEESYQTGSSFSLEYTLEKEISQIALVNACQAINKLSKEKIPLPVFSARVLGNPHELDRDRLTGKIFIALIGKEKNRVKPRNTEELAEFYFDENLLIDEYSNMVLCKNIVGKRDEKFHEGWLGFYKAGEAMQITLSQLSKIDTVDIKLQEAMVVENPAVFATLSEQTNLVPIVCTYGQVKLSGKILLDLLIKSGVTLYYSGDLDPEGIQIADKLKQRYQDQLILVGFDSETYHKNMSEVHLRKERLKKMQQLKSKELKWLAQSINFFEKAAYEEKNLENLETLLKDIEERGKVKEN